MKFYSIVLLATLSFLSPTALAQNFVANGNFETDTFTVGPGYTGGGNPDQISGWMGNGNNGINPVFVPQNPTSIVGWTKSEDASGNLGLNPVADARSPFADNGIVEGGALFMQGIMSAYQDVAGLTVGEDYVMSVDYNSRSFGDIPSVFLELNGVLFDAFPDPDEFFDETVSPVDDPESPWWTAEIPFTAESPTMRVEFFTEPLNGGDATFLLDNVELTSAAGGENLLTNGDFEQDLDLWTAWPGYVSKGAGVSAPFRDNGANDTQVALIQNAGSIEQLVEGLTPGVEYTFSLEYNARNCCGDFPVPEVLIDDEPLQEFPFDEVVFPVEEDNEWYVFETTVTPEGDSVLLKIQTLSDTDGDSTFLVDNVFFGIPGNEVAGDFNGNGELELSEIDSLGAAIAANSNDLAFDLNGDGLLSLADIDLFLGNAGKLNGDTDFSGGVAFPDFLTLSANFAKQGISWSGGDLDGNGAVLFPDFLIFSSNFGKTSAAQSVPEPHGLVLLAMGLPLLLGRRRNR